MRSPPAPPRYGIDLNAAAANGPAAGKVTMPMPMHGRASEGNHPDLDPVVTGPSPLDRWLAAFHPVVDEPFRKLEPKEKAQQGKAEEGAEGPDADKDKARSEAARRRRRRGERKGEGGVCDACDEAEED